MPANSLQTNDRSVIEPCFWIPLAFYNQVFVFWEKTHVFTQGLFCNTGLSHELHHPKRRTPALSRTALKLRWLLLGAVQTEFHADACGVKPAPFPRLYLSPCHSTAQMQTSRKRRKKREKKNPTKHHTPQPNEEAAKGNFLFQVWIELLSLTDKKHIYKGKQLHLITGWVFSRLLVMLSSHPRNEGQWREE